MVDRMRTMPKATIAKIEGTRAAAAASSSSRATCASPRSEVPCWHSPRSRSASSPAAAARSACRGSSAAARALEIILGCDDVPADLAERWGYVNRALPPVELGPFVERLARRIASFPAEAIALAKQAVNAADAGVVEGLLEEADCFNRSVATPAARERMAAFMAGGGQSREVEKGVGKLAALLAR